ncbi:MAG TPA: VOC family protein [Candidatus Thiothrix moscowensis]|uniref:VOC family protein n=1 Tax=unclassified Thiothrix TaxID=2636184 RepID=UPI0025FEB46A|nr:MULTISPECIES: VOC family protein [unclassified Thiothrix]HRJ52992.1 VOC family protein [Candidatus Thiothrix moscowensis]HRJ92964.1 VOC family protein [Candidatus Thiothrix moscowensis]
MTIHALHHVSLIVSDTSRSLNFYRDLLGLSVDDARPDLGFPGAWLTINNQQQIHLLELPNPEAGLLRPAHGGRDRHLALWCNDIDALAARLQTAGIAISRSKSGRQALFCRDPDDNAVEIMQCQPT